jgi:hypothetical protein
MSRSVDASRCNAGAFGKSGSLSSVREFGKVCEKIKRPAIHSIYMGANIRVLHCSRSPTQDQITASDGCDSICGIPGQLLGTRIAERHVNRTIIWRFRG